MFIRLETRKQFNWFRLSSRNGRSWW